MPGRSPGEAPRVPCNFRHLAAFGPRVRELRAKAEGFERALRAWSVRPPTEEQRATLLKLVLDLNVEVMTLGRTVSSESRGK